MCNAVAVRVKYQTPDHNGETRADFHVRFNQPCDDYYEVPECVDYIWDWFWDLQTPFNYVRDGEPLTLTHFELKSWRENMQIDVSPWEIECLMDMSKSWASAMSVEIKRSQEKQRSEAEKSKGKVNKYG